ncbi:argininosuccinate lyase [Sulfolobales archaeon HS-7]|nr:argininosuccinate lyase [Sulfolobales archaeon HS-7]
MNDFAIWKGGLGYSEKKEAQDFVTGKDREYDVIFFKYEILALLSYHISLHDKEIIKKETSKEIIRELINLYGQQLDMIQEEDIHTEVEKLVLKANAEAGVNLRVLLSRNEQIHTDIRLFLIDSLLHLKQECLLSAEEIKKKGVKEDGIIPGYTHYRQAMPTTWSTYTDYIASTFVDFSKKISQAIQDLMELPLGYGSGFGSFSPADWKEVSQMLGFREIVKNPLLASSFRGVDELRVIDLLKEIMLRISRFSQDLILWSSEELGFISLPKAFVTGSSLMPNKANPDFLEMVEGYAALILSNSVTVSTLLLSKTSGYHRDFQIAKWCIIESLDIVFKTIKYFRKMVSEIEFLPDVASKVVQNSSFATGNAASEVISGTPWKDAYAKIGKRITQGIKLETYSVTSFEAIKLDELAKLIGEAEEEIRDRDQIYSKLIERSKIILNS